MTEEILAQQSAVGVMAASADPAKKIFLGMTGLQAGAFAAGVVLGGFLCYAGYRYYKNRTCVDFDGNVISDEGESLFEEKKHYKSMRELISRQEHVSVLDGANLQEWFRNNHVETEDAKLMLAIPTAQTLSAVGYRLEEDGEGLDKRLIQAIYNSKNGTIYKLRFVAFDSIDSLLQAKLLENDGLVILDA